MLDQSDIHEILTLLNAGMRHQDWDQVTEAIDYLTDFLDDDISEE